MDEVDWKDVLDDVKRHFANERKHAPYFFFRGDKPGTEWDAVKNWIGARFRGIENSPFVEFRHLSDGEDPPDVVLTTRENETYAIEVTELVDCESIEATEQGRSFDEKEYDAAEAEILIRARVTKKDCRSLSSAFECRILLIYSDEMGLCRDEVISHLKTVKFSPLRNLDEVYFMYPPAVNISGGESQNPFCQLVEFPTDDVNPA